MNSSMHIPLTIWVLQALVVVEGFESLLESLIAD